MKSREWRHCLRENPWLSEGEDMLVIDTEHGKSFTDPHILVFFVNVKNIFHERMGDENKNTFKNFLENFHY